MIRFVKDREVYEQVIRDRVPLAKKRLWIATADIKDMYVDLSGRDMVPFLKVLAALIGKGIRACYSKQRSSELSQEPLLHSGVAFVDRFSFGVGTRSGDSR